MFYIGSLSAAHLVHVVIIELHHCFLYTQAVADNLISI